MELYDPLMHGIRSAPVSAIFFVFFFWVTGFAAQPEPSIRFPQWHELSQTELGQTRSSLLCTLLECGDEQQMAEKEYLAFQAENEAQLLAFFMITHVMNRMEVDFGLGRWESVIGYFQGIFRLDKDRVFFEISPDFFESWKREEGKYRLRSLEDTEYRKIKFHKNSTRAGSLHAMQIKGKRIKAAEQVYTSSFFNFPRVQFNFYQVRETRSVIEVDLDATPPWWLGIIPNFNHQSFNNSYVLANYKKFFKKFGNPGVEIRFDAAGIQEAQE